MIQVIRGESSYARVQRFFQWANPASGICPDNPDLRFGQVSLTDKHRQGNCRARVTLTLFCGERYTCRILWSPTRRPHFLTFHVSVALVAQVQIPMNKKKRELEQNELADALGSKLDEIRPYIPKIAIFSAVGVLAVVAIAFYFSTRKSVHESQWREYFVSSRLADSRGMKTVAEIFPNTTVGNLALINAADTDYANGSVNIVKNREDYESQLRQAIENYELALQSSSVDRFASAGQLTRWATPMKPWGALTRPPKCTRKLWTKMPTHLRVNWLPKLWHASRIPV